MWFDPEKILWGYDDKVWEAYAVFGQPVSVLISSDDVVVGGWYGAAGDSFLRQELDRLVAIG